MIGAFQSCQIPVLSWVLLGCGPLIVGKFNLRKVCVFTVKGQLIKMARLCVHYCESLVRMQVCIFMCNLCSQMAPPIMCTTTSHVITLASRVTVLALVSPPKTSVRSSASVARNVSIQTLGMLRSVSADIHIL